MQPINTYRNKKKTKTKKKKKKNNNKQTKKKNKKKQNNNNKSIKSIKNVIKYYWIISKEDILGREKERVCYYSDQIGKLMLTTLSTFLRSTFV